MSRLNDLRARCGFSLQSILSLAVDQLLDGVDKTGSLQLQPLRKGQ